MSILYNDNNVLITGFSSGSCFRFETERYSFYYLVDSCKITSLFEKFKIPEIKIELNMLCKLEDDKIIYSSAKDVDAILDKVFKMKTFV